MRVKKIGDIRVIFNKGRCTITLLGADGPIVSAPYYREARAQFDQAMELYIAVKKIIAFARTKTFNI